MCVSYFESRKLEEKEGNIEAFNNLKKKYKNVHMYYVVTSESK